MIVPLFFLTAMFIMAFIVEQINKMIEHIRYKYMLDCKQIYRRYI